MLLVFSWFVSPGRSFYCGARGCFASGMCRFVCQQNHGLAPAVTVSAALHTAFTELHEPHEPFTHLLHAMNDGGLL